MISDKISLKKILEWPKGFYYYFKIQVSKYFNKTVQSQLPNKNITPKKMIWCIYSIKDWTE